MFKYSLRKQVFVKQYVKSQTSFASCDGETDIYIYCKAFTVQKEVHFCFVSLTQVLPCNPLSLFTPET